MVVFRLWRGVSRTDGTYSRVVDEFLAEHEDDEDD